jgi:hypothetical protein
MRAFVVLKGVLIPCKQYCHFPELENKAIVAYEAMLQTFSSDVLAFGCI